VNPDLAANLPHGGTTTLHLSFAVVPVRLYFLVHYYPCLQVQLDPFRLIKVALIMSEEQEPSVALGKHSREDSPGAEDGPQMPAADVDDSSDEEIGPMPIPESANGGDSKNIRKKKKRAGELAKVFWWKLSKSILG
jgi:hypothetical protein